MIINSFYSIIDHFLNLKFALYFDIYILKNLCFIFENMHKFYDYTVIINMVCIPID